MAAVAVAMPAIVLTVPADFSAAHAPSPAAHVRPGGGGDGALALAGVDSGVGGGGTATDRRSMACSTTSSVGKTDTAPVGVYVAMICVASRTPRGSARDMLSATGVCAERNTHSLSPGRRSQEAGGERCTCWWSSFEHHSKYSRDLARHRCSDWPTPMWSYAAAESSARPA